jgi:hypothetical protein
MLWIHNTEFKIYQREEYVPAASVPDPDLDPPDPRVFWPPDPLVRGMDPDPALDPDPSIIMQI